MRIKQLCPVFNYWKRDIGFAFALTWRVGLIYTNMHIFFERGM